MVMGTSRSDSHIIEVINDLTPVALCVAGGKLFLLVKHYRFINFRDAPRALICKVKWPDGYTYISNPIKKLNQITWHG